MEKKEIENYFIIPNAIYRLIRNVSRKKDSKLSVDLVREKIDNIVEDLCDSVMDNYSSGFLKYNKGKDLVSANRYARELLNELRKTSSMINRVSGKELLAQLSNWSKSEFGVSLTMHQLVQEIELSEYDPEFMEVIEKIDKCIFF